MFTSTEINKLSNIDSSKLRWNSSGTKCVLKFEGDCPIWATSKPLYNRQQINQFMLTW